ncbi:formate hydrogenlyase subunit 3/multisubunit Na+/H+ antiporter MnhD subunit [Kribbella orskensis]|uniref:Formate hydrogenlyase subunit 3/multisubunit Na+/H+ antiporter MnhD subunit n=1 Tax=Kribbella orskensis TaxID=2512216 RepID=A0ABY2B9Y8_9ACTN|nr:MULTISPECIES: proton-conducting transporter membrane subunit [Kribbella]TCN32929.1 formate hydrogenlyase subunit 3/multisubunit Na+/H+ antiporter MnhD subunit [Kribbella sp. VKM Ac-2500]TCO13197.1 formate hydrogenlyase subunit 3/multisubunit Na+/H+ antiporter MnhD subunit [Kribbella orskensis]
MNLVAQALLGGTFFALAGAVGAALTGPRVRAVVAGVSTSACGAGGLLAGIALLDGQTYSATMPGLLPLGTAAVAGDALSGVFVALVGAVAVIAGIYSIGYTSPGSPLDHGPGSGAGSRTVQAVLPLFVATMVWVPIAGNVTTFLVLWELMALTSLVLVLAEHRARPQVRTAAAWYASMTHAGFVAILLALVLFSSQVGGDSFAALRVGAAELPTTLRSVIFLLAFVGFGSKAGIVPLHVWLPRAHPEAPSHVSALMSAAMVTLGLYGILRVGFDLLGGGQRWWWVLVLAAGAVSALYGVLQACVAVDLKRLLGYSTTENMGLVLMGVGAAGIFAADGDRLLATLLLAASVLHAINHAGFKTLLFLGAGSVLRSTGLRDLDSLGGLVSRMPITTALFGVGALAAAALPPGNGFVSEWLLLQGLIHSLPAAGSPSVLIAVAMPLAVGVVALTAGLGVATYVKAFGVGFLARPRSVAAGDAIESPVSMRAAMALAASGCAVLAILPAMVGPSLNRVAATFPTVRDGAPLQGGVTLRLTRIAGSMSPLLILCGLFAAALVIVVTLRFAGRRLPRRQALVWGCGGTRLDPRMEYTATSFAEPLTRVFDDVLAPEQDIDVTHHAESRYLIESVQYRQKVADRVEVALYPPLLGAAIGWGRQAGRLQNGSVHRYLAFGLVGLLIVLVVVGVTS